jgi:hypothetical protein
MGLNAMIACLTANGWTKVQIAVVIANATTCGTLTTDAKAAFGLAS